MKGDPNEGFRDGKRISVNREQWMENISEKLKILVHCIGLARHMLQQSGGYL
jgi:hypothetical protein